MKKFLILILVVTGAISAQSREKVRAELERTDGVIQRVRLVVEPSGNEEARLILNQAIAIQNSAWDGYRAQRYRWALGRTFLARKRAWEAHQLVLMVRVEEEFRWTAEVMNEAGPLLSRSDVPKVRELWRMAQSEQLTAREHLRARRMQMALRFTIAARRHTQSALKLLKSGITPEMVTREMERTDGVIQRATEPIRARDNFRAQEMFARAGELQIRARNALRQRLFGQALRWTLASRELVLRVLLLESGLADDDFNAVFEETEQLFVRWTRPIEFGDSEEAKGLLRQAQEHQADARRLKEAGDIAGALNQTNQARFLLNRAIELIGVNEPE